MKREKTCSAFFKVGFELPITAYHSLSLPFIRQSSRDKETDFPLDSLVLALDA